MGSSLSLVAATGLKAVLFYTRLRPRRTRKQTVSTGKKGSCKFAENNCRYKHDPEKEAVNASKRKRSEDKESGKEDREDFLISLVKALAHGKAGEAQLGSGTESAHRMEGQRNTRLRMGSPVDSSRGMDGQERNRSYASTVGSEYRGTSSYRGMEDRGGLIEQAVDMI